VLPLDPKKEMSPHFQLRQRARESPFQKTFSAYAQGKANEMDGTQMRQIIANLPSEARLEFTPGLAWLLAGLRTYRRVHSIEVQSRFNRMALLLTHLPGLLENQWCLGVRSCLPLRGSSGFAPDSL
jgi:hypothetical protein